MYAGQIVEYGTVNDIFYNPKHPYTWGLLGSMPDLNNKSDERLYAIPGSPPDLTNPPKGDAFAPRNKYALAIDFEKDLQCLKYPIHIMLKHGYCMNMHRKSTFLSQS